MGLLALDGLDQGFFDWALLGLAGWERGAWRRGPGAYRTPAPEGKA